MLTATANNYMQDEILKIAKLNRNDVVFFKESLNRPNLHLEVFRKSNVFQQDVGNIFQWIKKNEYLNSSGIIYCQFTQDCEIVAKTLNEFHNIAVGKDASNNILFSYHYHAQMPAEKRTEIQNKWMDNNIHVLCATTALGMGVNKPNVRFVLHYYFPQTMDALIQESGRAGRDRHTSHCCVLYSKGDKQRLLNLIVNNKRPGSEKEDYMPDPQQVLYDQQKKVELARVVAYCENKEECRRKLQLAFLDQDFDERDCNNTCDNCINRMTQHASKKFKNS
jgi:bloom syndrome protein